jgi:hypothetical protein
MEVTSQSDDDWLSTILADLLNNTHNAPEMAIRKYSGEARAAINAKITELLIAAREEQVMQDFLSLNVDFDGCVDESDLIVWRQERLAQLQASQPINLNESEM